ncbi:MAG: hypothetical protein LQ338_008331, partial [Usnochroma carphineum]
SHILAGNRRVSKNDVAKGQSIKMRKSFFAVESVAPVQGLRADDIVDGSAQRKR